MEETEIRQLIERLRTLGRDDSQCEVKTCENELSKDVWESVSAFANTRGGILLLGLSEKNGFLPVPSFKIDRVCDQLVSGMEGGGAPGKLENPPEYQVDRVIMDGAAILVVHIKELEASRKPCYIRDRGVQNGSYKRVDDKDVRLSANELYALQTAVAVDVSDRMPVEGASIFDLDSGLCEALFARALVLSPRALRGADESAERFRRLNLMNAEGGITRAGLLVVGKYPQQFFPKLVVDVATHSGVTKGADGNLRFRDRVVCEGTLGEVIGDSVHAVAKNLRRSSIVVGLERSDELEVPESVLREAITNALIHRSYNACFDGEAVAVDVFDDRIEIVNPGGLWGKSWDDLADGRSCCRNTTLMKLMSLAPLREGAGSPAEGNGTGILLMREEMKRRGLKPPEFRPAFDHFRVILWRPAANDGRSRAVRIGKAFVERFLEEHGEASLKELVEGSGLTTSQVRLRVNDLIDSGRVEATAPPQSRNRRYRLRQ